MQKAKILYDDPAGRFKRGEVGEVLKGCPCNHNVKLELDAVNGTEKRTFYFQKDDVEFI